MKQTIRRNQTQLPYSLHDSIVTELVKSEDQLTVRFQNGFVAATEPYPQVEGELVFAHVDWDFSSVYLLSYPDAFCGNTGRFFGEKMALEVFLEMYGTTRFDLVDETYGFHLSKFDGFLSAEDGCTYECKMEIYHLGDMQYLVKP